jgi:hypothetical protein
VVVSWPLDPRFVGLDSAKDDGFLRGDLCLEHEFLQRGSKAIGPLL